MKKAMHALGATLMLGGVIVGPVSAVAHADDIVRSSVESSSSSSVASQASSKSAVVLSKMSNKNGNNLAASSSDMTAANSSSSVSSSSTAGSSTSATPIGQTIITSTPHGASIDSNNQPTGSQGIEPHFHTANGDVVYCYNWQSQCPDVTNGVDYNQYKFFDGMSQVTGNNDQKVAEVAAALEAGYHKDATTGQYEIAPQFQQDAQDDFNNLSNMEGSALKPGPLSGIVPNNETLADFEEDVTQSVIWYLDGAPDGVVDNGQTVQEGYLATHTKLGKDILNYAKSHPLDKQTAYPQNVSVTANGKKVDSSNPLVMDPTTKESNTFTLSNYNGGVDIAKLPAGYEIVDANGNKVNQVQSGQTYRVKYVGNGDPSSDKANQVVGNIQAQASYESLKNSNYFSAVMQNAPAGMNNEWQNMVNLETGTSDFDFPVIWTTSSSKVSSSSATSESSSASSKESSASSTKVSSSSSKKSSSSSVKSSSSKASSSSSSAKAVSSSKTVASSSKKATVSSKKVVASSSSAKKVVVVAAKSSSAKGQGEGHGHGLPHTGNAIEAGLAIIGAMMAAAGAFIAGFKRNKKQD